MKREFDKLAERLEQALTELRSGSPTDAMRTLENAQQERVSAAELHKQQLHLEFWK